MSTILPAVPGSRISLCARAASASGNSLLSGYDATGWNGIGAPRGTPSAIIEKLNKEINAIVLDPATKARLISLGVEPLSMTRAEFGKRIADDTEKWAKVIKFANITAE